MFTELCRGLNTIYIPLQATGKHGFGKNVLKKFYCREIHAIIDITYNGGIQPCALTMPEINIKHNRSQGLLKMWETASQGIKEDMDNGRFRKYCNGCCNHFSRNMIASAMKYPFRNRKIVFKTGISVLSRFIFTIFKKLFIRN